MKTAGWNRQDTHTSGQSASFFWCCPELMCLKRRLDVLNATPDSFLFSYSGLETRSRTWRSTPHLRPPWWVMRKHLDTVSVVWEEIPLSLPSLGGRLTDRNSREQQADEVVSGPIDCQLTGEVHYTDRPETQHHSTYVLITSHESLPGTQSPLCFSHLWLLF